MNKSLWTEWETERKTLWILSIDLKNDSVLPPSVFELNSSALSLIRQTQNYSIFCVSAFIDRDECATNRDRQDRLKERRKPMPINSCSWGFNFSKKKFGVCAHYIQLVIVQTISRLYARITHTSHESFFSFEQSSRLHTYTSLTLTLSIKHTYSLTLLLPFSSTPHLNFIDQKSKSWKREGEKELERADKLRDRKKESERVKVYIIVRECSN